MERDSVSEDYPDYRRNFASIAGDWVCFVIAMAFINYTSVIPSFINRLTDFAPLIGLVITIANGAWLMPQLLAANHVASRAKKKPFVVALALTGRPMYLLVALVIILTGEAYPWLLLAAFFLAETIFSTTDGLSSVAWFDIMSKSIPPTRRGRLFSTAQITGGILAMVAGVAVRHILGPSGPAFPENYGLLFFLCVMFLFMSLGSFSFVKEPVHEVLVERQSWRAYLPRLAALLRGDEQFRLINTVRLLTGLGSLAMPFYVVYATDVLQISDEYVGLFVSAQVLGGVIASVAMGYLNEKSGSKIVTQVTVALSLSVPVLALLIHYWPPPSAIAAYVYALVFVLIGANFSGHMQGFMNFVLEMSPPDERPVYVGLYNTLAGTLVIIVPLLGGLLLQATSYPILYGTAALGITVSLFMSFKLAEPRQT
jgi:MFS family permease